MSVRIPKRPQRRKPEEEPQRITITAGTMIKFILIIIGFFFLWFIRDIIGIVFIALVFASALDPWVDKLARRRIPRWLSITGFFILFLAAIGFTVYAIIPPFMQQIGEIAGSLPELAPQIDSAYQYVTQRSDASLTADLQASVASFDDGVSQITSGVYNAVVGLFGSIAALLLVLVLAFYMTVDEDGIKKFIRSTAPIQYQPYLVQKVNKIQMKMGAWLRGQLVVMLALGVLSFIGLAALGVPYALVLAVLAALFALIPFLGPILGAIPAVFFAYTDAPWKAIAVIAVYTVIQQLEGQIITPKVMEKAVGLSPIVVIVAMLIGAKLGGIIGIVLAIPATLIVWVFVEDFFVQKRKMDSELEGSI